MVCGAVRCPVLPGGVVFVVAPTTPAEVGGSRGERRDRPVHAHLARKSAAAAGGCNLPVILESCALCCTPQGGLWSNLFIASPRKLA